MINIESRKNNEGNYTLSVLVDVKTIYSDDKKEIVTKVKTSDHYPVLLSLIDEK